MNSTAFSFIPTHARLYTPYNCLQLSSKLKKVFSEYFLSWKALLDFVRVHQIKINIRKIGRNKMNKLPSQIVPQSNKTRRVKQRKIDNSLIANVWKWRATIQNGAYICEVYYAVIHSSQRCSQRILRKYVGLEPNIPKMRAVSFSIIIMLPHVPNDLPSHG